MTTDTSKQFMCIIGAQRSGSTWLYRMLDAHPEIAMAKPLRPEPKFFISNDFDSADKEFYLDRYFDHVNTEKVIGEKSTSYIEHPIVADRILNMFPDAKLIAIIRHPATRAISNYKFSVKHGLENRSLRDVFINKTPPPELKAALSVSPFDYLERSDYAHYLVPYRAIFKNRLKILVFEELLAQESELQELYNWLGVSPDFMPDGHNTKVNASHALSLDEENAEILEHVKRVCLPFTHRVETLIGRPIPAWHDPVQ